MSYQLADTADSSYENWEDSSLDSHGSPADHTIARLRKDPKARLMAVLRNH